MADEKKEAKSDKMGIKPGDVIYTPPKGKKAPPKAPRKPKK